MYAKREWLNEPNDIKGDYLRNINEFRREMIAYSKQLQQKREKQRRDALRDAFMAQQKSKAKSKSLIEEGLKQEVQAEQPQATLKDKNVSEVILNSLQIGTADELLQKLKARKPKLAPDSELGQQ
ncbi:hypothetical protein RFI_13105 [Reticulomyxa filosa]|uniref:Uncharacterized protein n=1 Tax=Reticulomyxa filosa TaxID=46433 RepID=X6NCL7_RETFI|nr:hypothetical protein RFI_13105 [Reticulomyxa filosa]|eukprot:ETO24055.1 hypothetical protein RFI_13105 [Reticulomyxa filosa]